MYIYIIYIHLYVYLLHMCLLGCSDGHPACLPASLPAALPASPFVSFFIKMLDVSLGVACGAKKLLYFMLTIICSRYFCFWDARRGKKMQHFDSKTMKNIKNNKYMYKGAGRRLKW